MLYYLGPCQQIKWVSTWGSLIFFIVLPQMLAASMLGFFVQRVLGGQAVLALVLGGITWVIAAILTLFVDDIDAP